MQRVRSHHHRAGTPVAAAKALQPDEFSASESALLLGAFLTLALSLLAFATL